MWKIYCTNMLYFTLFYVFYHNYISTHSLIKLNFHCLLRRWHTIVKTIIDMWAMRNQVMMNKILSWWLKNIRPIPKPQANNHLKFRRRGRKPYGMNLDDNISEDGYLKWGYQCTHHSISDISRTVLKIFQINDKAYVPKTSTSL